MVVGTLSDDKCGELGAYGARKVFRADAPEGLAQPWWT